MGLCFDKRVIAGLAAVAVAVLVFAPNLFGAALPLLVLVACPLSMLVMMRMMSGSQDADSCAAGRSARSEENEIAQLRAEVERLRSDRARGRDEVVGEPSRSEAATRPQ